MSSATSIERAGARTADSHPRPRDTFKPWHFFVLASLLIATGAVVLARQSRPEHLVLISLTIGAAGFAAAAFYRMLMPLVSDNPTAVEPLTESMRAMLEREKLLTLRSIKELEFDRAMGKVAQKDFDEMAGRLKARAMVLMKQLDAEGGYREIIERELSSRLRSAKGSAKPERTERDCAAATLEAASARRACVCGTVNDSDAAFCKRCGTKLAASING